MARGKAEAAHSRFRRPAVKAGLGDGIANATVRQPAGVAAVQSREPPRGVQLAHFGDVTGVFRARLQRFGEVELGWAGEEVDAPCGKERTRRHLVKALACLAMAEWT